MRLIRSALISAFVMVTAQASAASTKPIAVLFHADWCLNCKLLNPRLEPLKAEYGDRIEFLVVDYTSDEGRAAGGELAQARGFSPLFQQNRATGWVALMQPGASEYVRLTVKMSDAQLRAAFDAALES